MLQTKGQPLPAILNQLTSLAFKHVQILYHISLIKCLAPASQVQHYRTQLEKRKLKHSYSVAQDCGETVAE